MTLTQINCNCLLRMLLNIILEQTIILIINIVQLLVHLNSDNQIQNYFVIAQFVSGRL